MSVCINSFYRKARINQNCTTNIYLRFTVNRRSRYVSTGINIPADDWDFDTQTLKTQNPAVQLRIYEQIGKYDKRIKRLEALEVPVTLDEITVSYLHDLECSCPRMETRATRQPRNPTCRKPFTTKRSPRGFHHAVHIQKSAERSYSNKITNLRKRRQPRGRRIRLFERYFHCFRLPQIPCLLRPATVQFRSHPL